MGWTVVGKRKSASGRTPHRIRLASKNYPARTRTWTEGAKIPSATITPPGTERRHILRYFQTPTTTNGALGIRLFAERFPPPFGDHPFLTKPPGDVYTHVRRRPLAGCAVTPKLKRMNTQIPDVPQNWIVETTAATFDLDVLQRSREVPIVVDFWAPWCGPCRALGPLLERLAEEYAGRFVLVKANTDELPEAAAAFQVQSIPAVFGVIDGQLADFFNGALPEPQIRSWLDRLLQSQALKQAAGLEENQPGEAAATYRRVLEDQPNEAQASIGLARCLIQLQEFAEAQQIVAKLEERGFLEPEAERVKAALEMQAKGGIDVDASRRAAQAAPDDLPAQLAYAEALAGDHQYQAALELALSLVQRDRSGVGEAARQLMVDIFRVLPADSELVSQYRRQLSMALY